MVNLTIDLVESPCNHSHQVTKQVPADGVGLLPVLFHESASSPVTSLPDSLMAFRGHSWTYI